MKEEFLKKLWEADVESDDWDWELMNTLPHGYAKGYLEAKSGEWNSNGGEYNEEYREMLAEWCEYFDWE